MAAQFVNVYFDQGRLVELEPRSPSSCRRTPASRHFVPRSPWHGLRAGCTTLRAR